jgi:hypothetical protein
VSSKISDLVEAVIPIMHYICTAVEKLNTVFTWASETWILTKRERQQINVMKGKCIEEL